jgi:hypothetical protein
MPGGDRAVPFQALTARREPFAPTRLATRLLALALLSSAGTLCHGQTGTASTVARPAAPDLERSIEDLNLVGGSATMPRISDSVLGTESGFRRTLFRKGVLIRARRALRGSTPCCPTRRACRTSP